MKLRALVYVGFGLMILSCFSVLFFFGIDSFPEAAKDAVAIAGIFGLLLSFISTMIIIMSDNKKHTL